MANKLWKSSKPGFTPSSSSTGFFVERPRLPNQVYEDQALDRVRKLYLPSQINTEITPELERFGDLALSPQVLTYIADAERNLPYLHTYSTFGQRQDILICSEGWRELQNLTIKEGIVAIPYESAHGEFSRVHQFVKYHLWSGSNAGVTCPSAMSDGAASFLKRHLAAMKDTDPKKKVLQAAYNRLTSRDPEEAWTSGQWMTERPGGSDVSRSETVAVHAELDASVTAADGQPLGDWSVSGFKWFSSATDANMTILLARTPEGKLSTFFAPMRRTLPSSSPQSKIQDSELNGVKVMQLKRKLGTKPLPTAELELNDMRAYLLGDAGNGIREISTILNITRVHNSVTSVGDWGRGLAIKKAFARVRTVAGEKPLYKMPAHTAIMARDEVGYRGWMNLAFFTVLLLGLSENPTSATAGKGIDPRLVPTPSDVQNLLRVLTPVLKAGSAKACITGLQECVEGLGGVGFCENEDQDLNVARIYRDANVLSIWEGTTETLAWDLVKILKGRKGGDVLKSLNNWIEGAKPSQESAEAWRKWVEGVTTKGEEELLVMGRFVSEELARVVGGVLLEIDASRDNCPVALEVARRWKAGTQDWKEASAGGLKERELMDARIVWGDAVAFGGAEPKL